MFGKSPRLCLAACLGACGVLAGSANAATIYVTATDGKIYEYDSVTDMGGQDSSTLTGTEVASHAAYATDQGSTMDLSTGKVYRVTGAGDVVEYADLAGYLANTGASTLASGVFTGDRALNGVSYDGATGGFYGTVVGASTTNSGDTLAWASLADLLTDTTSSVTDTGFGGNLFNFYDPDATAGTTFGNSTAKNTQYYQSAGNGRLEGWESLVDYVQPGGSQGGLRVHYTGTNAFGGTSAAFGDASIDAATAFAVPEPGSLALLAVGAAFMARRRRDA